MSRHTIDVRRVQDRHPANWRTAFRSGMPSLEFRSGGYGGSCISVSRRTEASSDDSPPRARHFAEPRSRDTRRAGIARILGSTVWSVSFAVALFVLLPFASAPAAADAGVRLDGPRTQGGLLRGRVPVGSTVEYEGDPVRVSQDGWFLVGFGRDAPPEAKLVVVLPDGRRESRVLKVGRREYDIQRIDGLPARKVTPRSEEDLARIRAEVEMVRKARTIDGARADFLSGFRWPTKGRIKRRLRLAAHSQR